MKSEIVAITIVFAAAIAAMAGGGPGAPPSASACRVGQLSSWSLPGVFERNPIVATGHFEDVREWEATFVVEEGFKGAKAGDRLAFDNRQPGLDAGCGTYADDAPGNRFDDGDRRLIFLEGPVDGLWRIGQLGIGVFAVQDDALAPLTWDWGRGSENSPMTIDAARAAIAAVPVGGLVDREAVEVELGCRPPMMFVESEIPQYTAISDAVAIISVETGATPGTEPYPVPATVLELIRGELPGDFRLNGNWISDYETRDCTPKLEPGSRFQAGTTYLVFLRKDEFGIGDYRPVAWSQAAIEVNERYLTGGAITIAHIRRLTGTVVTATAPDVASTDAGGTEALVDAASAGNSDDDRAWQRALVGFVVVAVAAAALWFVRGRRAS